MQPFRRQRHDCVVVVRLDESIVRVIDQEAEAEGLSRSAIIRRTLKRKYEPESTARQ
ncbi:MAG: CopG family transcriptional regulator [Nitrospira sp.]